jgi:hypothetical protein
VPVHQSFFQQAKTPDGRHPIVSHFTRHQLR